MRKDLNEKLLQRLQAVVVPTLQDADAVSRPPNSMWLRKPRKPRKLWAFPKVDHFDPSILLDVLQILLKFQPEILVKVPVFYYFFRWLVQPLTSLSSYMHSPKLSWIFRTEKNPKCARFALSNDHFRCRFVLEICRKFQPKNPLYPQQWFVVCFKGGRKDTGNGGFHRFFQSESPAFDQSVQGGIVEKWSTRSEKCVNKADLIPRNVIPRLRSKETWRSFVCHPGSLLLHELSTGAFPKILVGFWRWGARVKVARLV